MLTQDITIISIIAVVCIIMFFAGLRLRRNERRLDTLWIRTRGQIISYNPRDAGVGVQTTGKVTWYKKVKFVTQDGREIVDSAGRAWSWDSSYLWSIESRVRSDRYICRERNALGYLYECIIPYLAQYLNSICFSQILFWFSEHEKSPETCLLVRSRGFLL